MPAVDQHHSVLCQNDAGVGFEVLPDVGVDAVAELLELWPEILCTCGRGRNKSDERDPYCCGLDPHEGPPDNRRSALRPSLAGIPRKVACSRRGHSRPSRLVPKDEIDERYIDSPYYIAPDGPVGQEAFAVIRDTIAKAEHGRA